MTPERLWSISRWLYRRGHVRAARMIKVLLFFGYRCVLPPEVEVIGEVRFLHRALGVVLDPDVRIIGPTMIAQHVTIGTGGGESSSPRVTLERCFVGAGATIIAPRGRSIRVGVNAAVGASGHVASDVADGHRVGAPEARTVRVVDVA